MQPGRSGVLRGWVNPTERQAVSALAPRPDRKQSAANLPLEATNAVLTAGIGEPADLPIALHVPEEGVAAVECARRDPQWSVEAHPAAWSMRAQS